MFRLKNSKGLSMVEIMFATIILYLVLIGLIGLYVSTLKMVSIGKTETIAVALTNEIMEHARKLPYQDVGIIGANETGVPTGTLPETTQVVREGIDFTINNDVRWVDDDGDNENDYKKLRVTVSWLFVESETGRTKTSTYTATSFYRFTCLVLIGA